MTYKRKTAAVTVAKQKLKRAPEESLEPFLNTQKVRAEIPHEGLRKF